MTDIALYIHYELCNTRASNSFINSILIKISTLQQFPYMGSFYKNRQERFIVYKNFLIVYEIQEKEKIVRIKTIVNRRIAR